MPRKVADEEESSAGKPTWAATMETLEAGLMQRLTEASTRTYELSLAYYEVPVVKDMVERLSASRIKKEQVAAAVWEAILAYHSAEEEEEEDEPAPAPVERPPPLRQIPLPPAAVEPPEKPRPRIRGYPPGQDRPDGEICVNGMPYPFPRWAAHDEPFIARLMDKIMVQWEGEYLFDEETAAAFVQAVVAACAVSPRW